MSKKLISVCVPVYNEKENLQNAYSRITEVMQGIPAYDYEIVFFDDGSTDGSQQIIEELCVLDAHVKAVFYIRNFGYTKTVFYCIQQAKGDAAVIVHCDLQNPPEEIPRLIEKWEQGADIVLGVKNKSKENKMMYFLRTVGYFLLNLLFGMHMIPHATEFELFDKSFIGALRNIRTQNPYLRGYIFEYGKKIEKVYYTQERRIFGKSHFSLSKYYDFVIGAIVNKSKCLPRRIIFFTVVCAIIIFLEFLIHFLPACKEMQNWSVWNGLLLRMGLFLLLLIILLICILFEYVISVSKDAEQKPFILEKKRVNY